MTVQTPADEYSAQLSPDGEWFAYHSNESGGFEVYVRRFPSGTRKIVEMFLKLVQTSQPQVPYEHTIEQIAILEAGRIAQAEGRRVPLQEAYDGVAGKE